MGKPKYLEKPPSHHHFDQTLNTKISAQYIWNVPFHKSSNNLHLHCTDKEVAGA